MAWDGIEIRPDIDAVFASLDGKGQSSLTGLRTPRHVRKGLKKLPELIPDEQVLALAVGSDPPPTASEQRAMGAGAAFGEITQVAKSARLLVVTDTNFWEVQASGRLNGSRPKGIRTSLGDITDVRVLSERKMSRLGAKQRTLAIDQLRGAQVGTILIDISGSDETLQAFADALASQARKVAAAAGADQLSVGSGPSVADELAKLAALRDSGVLSETEFEAQKTKLLKRS